jgi:hypothetical protein
MRRRKLLVALALAVSKFASVRHPTHFSASDRQATPTPRSTSSCPCATYRSGAMLRRRGLQTCLGGQFLQICPVIITRVAPPGATSWRH